jgi:hypothetical protein
VVDPDLEEDGRKVVVSMLGVTVSSAVKIAARND